jgi:hypothetical protein
MNFRVIYKDGFPRILKTVAAADGVAVFGYLSMARDMLKERVAGEIRDLRRLLDIAVKTREGDLLHEDTHGEDLAAGLPAPEPGIDIPPAPSTIGPGAIGRDQDDLTDIPAHLRRT